MNEIISLLKMEIIDRKKIMQDMSASYLNMTHDNKRLHEQINKLTIQKQRLNKQVIKLQHHNEHLTEEITCLNGTMNRETMLRDDKIRELEMKIEYKTFKDNYDIGWLVD